MADPAKTDVETLVYASLAHTWSVFVPVDLTKLFKGRGPLPAVVRVFDQTGPWDVVGQTRSVSLSDGGELVEEITWVETPDKGRAGFRYIIRGFSGFIGLLTDSAEGDWSFTEVDGHTRVQWQYSFRPRGMFQRYILALVVRFLWRSYMKDALARTRSLIEADVAQGVSAGAAT